MTQPKLDRDDLIRQFNLDCAKTLGLRGDTSTISLPSSHTVTKYLAKVRNHGGWSYINTLCLGFDWDYNMAMLMVKKLTLKQFEVYEFRLAKKIGYKDLIDKSINFPLEMSYRLANATPAQISQACLEVLRSENG